MYITIAICTWNRSNLLDKTLNRFLLLNTKGCLYELIIVNNNSTDNTEDIIDKYKNLLPIKRVFEPTPGLSNARNAAVNQAKGDYIIWTDDDVLVDADWLKAYIRAFEKWPDISVFGGPVNPCFEGTPPEWLKRGWDSVSDAYAIRNLGNKIIPLEKEGNRLPYGANFAVRMSEQDKFLYNPALGVNQGEILLGEETEVILSIFNAGYSGIWVPDARVNHWLPKSRQTIAYLREYYEACGFMFAKNLQTSQSLNIFGIPRWFIRIMIQSYIAHFFNRIFRPPEVWIASCKQVYINRGIRKKLWSKKSMT